MSADRSPVVVGVDGSPGARAALEWAWAEAARRGAPLLAVSAFPVEDWWADPLLLDSGRVDALRSDTVARLTALVEEVCTDPAAGAPEVQLQVVAGAPAEHLVQLSAGAGLLVVGSRGRGGVRSSLLGSVALHCATSATCPVVVVHPVHRLPSLPPGALPASPRVVVGLDDSAAALSALVRAVGLADELDGEVEAVVAVRSPSYWGEAAAVGPAPLAELRERALARARAQVAWLPAPDQRRIRVRAEVGPAGAVLVRRSAGATLLVVGSRSRSRLPGMLLGSVTLHCVVQAPCPVVVVHADGAGRRRVDLLAAAVRGRDAGPR